MRSCGDGNKNRQTKSVGLISEKQLCTCSTLFFYISLPLLELMPSSFLNEIIQPSLLSPPPPPASNGLEINKLPWVLNGGFTVIYVFYSKAAFRSHESKTTDSTHRNRLQWRIQGGHPGPYISGVGAEAKKFFRPFGPRFGLKLRGGRALQAPPLVSPLALF